MREYEEVLVIGNIKISVTMFVERRRSKDPGNDYFFSPLVFIDGEPYLYEIQWDEIVARRDIPAQYQTKAANYFDNDHLVSDLYPICWN